jgi:hypothetical protein
VVEAGHLLRGQLARGLERRVLLQHLQGQAGQAVEQHQAQGVPPQDLACRDLQSLDGQPFGVRGEAGGSALGKVVRVLASHLDLADEQLGEVEPDGLGSPEAEVDEDEARIALAAEQVVGAGIPVRRQVAVAAELRGQRAEPARDAGEGVPQVAEVLRHHGVPPRRVVMEAG